MGKTKIHPMIFQIFLISSTYISGFFDPFEPRLLRQEELDYAFRKNLRIYNGLIGAIRFLNNCGFDESENLLNLRPILPRLPEYNRKYLERMLNEGRHNTIKAVRDEMIEDCGKLYYVMKTCKGLDSLIRKRCCNRDDRYDHGESDLPGYLKDLIWELLGQPQQYDDLYYPTWEYIIEKIGTTDKNLFFKMIAVKARSSQIYWSNIMSIVERLEPLTEDDFM